MGERILVIEDDPRLGAQISEYLSREGWEPVWWREGRVPPPDEAATYRLILLDLMLPGRYGMDVLRELREGSGAGSDIPVLILSARHDTADKVRALKLGADDYLTKPFWPEELVERVRARLRRPLLRRQGLVEWGTLRVDLDAREVQARGLPVELTRVEFDLLAALARRPGAAVTRQWLVEHVLDPEREGGERTLDVHVSRLRRKLGPDKWIQTVWGIGYRLGAGDAP